MKVEARGWKRDCGSNVLVDAELEDGLESDPEKTYSSGKTYLRVKKTGIVEILTGPHAITMGGKYQTIVSLTRSDIAILFASAFKDSSLEDVLTALKEGSDALPL